MTDWLGFKWHFQHNKDILCLIINQKAGHYKKTNTSQNWLKKCWQQVKTGASNTGHLSQRKVCKLNVYSCRQMSWKLTATIETFWWMPFSCQQQRVHASCHHKQTNFKKKFSSFLKMKQSNFLRISSQTAVVRSKEQVAMTWPNSGWAQVTRQTDPVCAYINNRNTVQ